MSAENKGFTKYGLKVYQNVTIMCDTNMCHVYFEIGNINSLTKKVWSVLCKQPLKSYKENVMGKDV